mmetsp:Transcript_37605/g.98583  ORF Transcript_37605/g.98583 Transcript_37605/m.98583 type:complete len:222 (+) Transcript_37605:1165-1830(+)
MGTFDGDSKNLAGKHVARGIKAPHVAIPRRRKSTVGSLRAPKPEFEQLDVWPHSNPVAGRVGAHKAGEVDHSQERRLHQLDKQKRAGEADQGDLREDDSPFVNCMQSHRRSVEGLEVLEELVFDIRGQSGPKILNVFIAEAKVLKKAYALIQSRKDGELAPEWVLSKKEIEGGNRVPLARFPIGVPHCNLVEIGQHRAQERVGIRRFNTLASGVRVRATAV